MKCPNCGEDCMRDEADVGVGIIYGPWGCYCGWSESEEYNSLTGHGGWRENGSYADSTGGIWPKDNPVTRMMRAAEDGEPQG